MAGPGDAPAGPVRGVAIVVGMLVIAALIVAVLALTSGVLDGSALPSPSL